MRDLTLGQVTDPSRLVEFDRKTHVGLNHLARSAAKLIQLSRYKSASFTRSCSPRIADPRLLSFVPATHNCLSASCLQPEGVDA
ncbi:hypothetical protein F4827_004159 [Paraburkholderia bannensis]|uniref:Uncharacterized protein n=1 Tax=Paraburkholderia bannensis TaxID=765414 RepID=A0A7W9U1P6_9BURK|nr:hypothetical protein [Paraburkholderia sp. WP4_3_2]MBB6104300.1 hypothetical protein [Paraburkholderia bannensis]